MIKRLIMILCLALVFCLVGCNKNQKNDETFVTELSNCESYKVEGVMETFFENGRRQNEFTVFYKKPDLMKVVLMSVENDDQQIILKNEEGVFILVPSVNKNFKIQSTWPTNASYPYLLQSLAKDIVSDEEAIITEADTTYTVEVKTKMHKDAEAVKEKIIFSRETSMPLEVLVYDENSNLFIRCVFTSIELDYNVSPNEFEVDESMMSAYMKYENGLNFNNREFNLPSYCPDGVTLRTNDTVKTGDNARSVMKFTGDKTFTIVQEMVNYTENMNTQMEVGEVYMLMGNVSILTENSVKFVYEGIEYTVASMALSIEELANIASSYMKEENK